MPHVNDVCLNKKCKKAYSEHKLGRGCAKFEFVAPSTRNDKDVMVSAAFQSDSSPRIYAAIAWRQGDFSCNCVGWRNNRTCWHVEDMKQHPAKYRGNKKTTKLVTAAETNDILSTLQTELSAAKSNPAMYNEIKTKIAFFQTALSVAAESIDSEVTNAAKTVARELSGDAKQKEKIKEEIIADADAADPFGDI